ncbi:hypothetical protein [Pseudomonas sichuanensis]|uniref:hypothetical protein n=1 Tax=Pseudomonas sichuanensis TaxID=2213015 RepID=UPI002ABA846F|nr:hypothetical protein [Pseudomonas sichuanensis]MDZ4019107.1 hypothetical protein [Pseudomonas sichuanensis]
MEAVLHDQHLWLGNARRLAECTKAAEGKAATLSQEAHTALMQKIDSARTAYYTELVALSYAVK